MKLPFSFYQPEAARSWPSAKDLLWTRDTGNHMPSATGGAKQIGRLESSLEPEPCFGLHVSGGHSFLKWVTQGSHSEK